MKITRNSLKRKIIDNLEKHLGCSLTATEYLSFKERSYKVHLDRLVFGTSKDGKAIWIYATKTRDRLPQQTAMFLYEQFKRGALVGCAHNFSDAWDIVWNDETQYKRKKRTWTFLKVLKEDDNGRDDSNPDQTPARTPPDAQEEYRGSDFTEVSGED